jgi:hypothetical protein
MNKYVYIHVCCINNWKDVFNNLYSNIKNSGLYEVVTSIKCNILTEDPTDIVFFNELNDTKIEVLGVHNDIKLYETPTINLLHEHSFQEDFYVLYIHTKGITRHNDNNINVNVTDWVNYLIYFNIYKHETCIQHLSENDAVGVNLQEKSNLYPLHYSGNFWWSKSTYLRTLSKCMYTQYNSPEYWLTEHKTGKYVSLWTSNVDHYRQRYEPPNYIH